MSPSSETPDPRPDLRIVEDGEPAAQAEAADKAEPAAPVEPQRSTPEPSPSSASPPAASTSYATWLLLAAVLLFAWLWLTQLEKANGLAANLATTQAGLASAKADIGAWESHGAQIKTGVQGIASQLGVLQELLADAPTTPRAPTSGTEFEPGANAEAGLAQDSARAE
jgi:hypothetical protein